MHPSAGASTSKARESSKPKDKWANYTSAKDLGIEGIDTSESSYEVEQQIKGRAAKDIGAWETVVEPAPVPMYYSEEGAVMGKRKLGEYDVNDEAAEGEEFKFAHKDKRPVRDPYDDDDDWDPKAALGQIRLKSKTKTEDGGKANVVKQELQQEKGVDIDRSKWTGRLDIGVPTSPTKGLVSLEGGSNRVEQDEAEESGATRTAEDEGEETKPALQDIKPDVEEAALEKSAPVPDSAIESTEDVKPEAPSSSSMFKKRRPPPKKK